jgi:hypothetical protein
MGTGRQTVWFDRTVGHRSGSTGVSELTIDAGDSANSFLVRGAAKEIKKLAADLERRGERRLQSSHHVDRRRVPGGLTAR